MATIDNSAMGSEVSWNQGYWDQEQPESDHTGGLPDVLQHSSSDMLSQQEGADPEISQFLTGYEDRLEGNAFSASNSGADAWINPDYLVNSEDHGYGSLEFGGEHSLEQHHHQQHDPYGRSIQHHHHQQDFTSSHHNYEIAQSFPPPHRHSRSFESSLTTSGSGGEGGFGRTSSTTTVTRRYSSATSQQQQRRAVARESKLGSNSQFRSSPLPIARSTPSQPLPHHHHRLPARGKSRTVSTSVDFSFSHAYSAAAEDSGNLPLSQYGGSNQSELGGVPDPSMFLRQDSFEEEGDGQQQETGVGVEESYYGSADHQGYDQMTSQYVQTDSNSVQYDAWGSAAAVDHHHHDSMAYDTTSASLSHPSSSSFFDPASNYQSNVNIPQDSKNQQMEQQYNVAHTQQEWASHFLLPNEVENLEGRIFSFAGLEAPSVTHSYNPSVDAFEPNQFSFDTRSTSADDQSTYSNSTVTTATMPSPYLDVHTPHPGSHSLKKKSKSAAGGGGSLSQPTSPKSAHPTISPSSSISSLSSVSVSLPVLGPAPFASKATSHKRSKFKGIIAAALTQYIKSVQATKESSAGASDASAPSANKRRSEDFTWTTAKQGSLPRNNSTPDLRVEGQESFEYF